MKTILELSPDVALPLEAVTARMGVFGVSGSGKTYTASVFAEEILLTGEPLVVLDPLGVWYGLRVVPDGTILPPIYILGGDRADLPLSATAGPVIADLVIDERLSVVLDLSHLAQDEQATFAAAFLLRLYERSRTPIHVIVDEADIFAPETPGSGPEWACRRALDTVVRRGRVRGIGVTLITQRPAVVAKSLISQVGTLVVHRLAAEQDRRAIDGWIKAHGTEAERKTIMGSLAALETGEAWFWSPEAGLLARTRVRRRISHDSSATPKVGAVVVRAEPKPLTHAALAALRERLTGAEEAAAETDVAGLQERIKDLQKQLRERPVERVVERVEVPVEVPILLPGEAARIRDLRDAMVETAQAHQETAKDLLNQAREITARLERIHREEISDTPGDTADDKPPEDTPEPPEAPETPAYEAAGGDPEPGQPPTGEATGKPLRLKPSHRKILRTLAEFAALGVRQVERANVVIWAGYSPNSSTFDMVTAELKRAGLVAYPSGGYLGLTGAGITEAGDAIAPIKSLQQLHEAWLRRLGTGPNKLLRELLKAHPEPLRRVDLAARTNYTPGSSTLDMGIAELKNLGLVHYPRQGTVAITSLLFPKGLQ